MAATASFTGPKGAEIRSLFPEHIKKDENHF